MVLPFSRLGVCGPSALAATVAGMVTNQNTAKPIAASSTTKIASLRNIQGPPSADGEHDATEHVAARHQLMGLPRLFQREATVDVRFELALSGQPIDCVHLVP